MENTKKVNPADYEIFEFSGGYYGICRKDGHGASPVWGGDSAWSDCYEIDLAKDVYEQWDGTLTHCTNDKYGEDGYTIGG